MNSAIVVDTDVLMHTNNPDSGKQESAVKFAATLKDSTISLAFDLGFHEVEAKNRSQIYGQYLAHLVPGTFGYEVVAYLIGIGRVEAVSKNADQRLRKWLVQNVADATDHLLVKVASNTDDKYLVSHDTAAFGMPLRSACCRIFSINIVDADGAVKFLLQ